MGVRCLVLESFAKTLGTLVSQCWRLALTAEDFQSHRLWSLGLTVTFDRWRAPSGSKCVWAPSIAWRGWMCPAEFDPLATVCQYLVCHLLWRTAPAIKAIAEKQPPVEHVGSHQPCCLCAASGHGCGGGSAVTSSGPAVLPTTTTVAPALKNCSLGEIATGMMLATGFAHWGWGYGLGWNKPDKAIIGESHFILKVWNLAE